MHQIDKSVLPRTQKRILRILWEWCHEVSVRPPCHKRQGQKDGSSANCHIMNSFKFGACELVQFACKAGDAAAMQKLEESERRRAELEERVFLRQMHCQSKRLRPKSYDAGCDV